MQGVQAYLAAAVAILFTYDRLAGGGKQVEEKKVKRVAIYARVSTEEQAEHGYSIDAQLDTLRKHCQQVGAIVVGEYVDRGISGKEISKRHELKRLLRDADAQAFDEVIAWKINRLSRKTKDLLDIVEQLSKNNIYFRSYSENFETETPMGRFALQMMGAVAELERNTIVENVKMGMKQRARMGLHNGGCCLGYKTVEIEGDDRKSRKNKLEIVPEEAIIVRQIFEMYAAGKGFRAIANSLNRKGYKTKKQNTFSSDSIREIITNPVYFGIVRYNRFEGWSEKRRRGKNTSPIMVEGKHEAIISKELWDKVQTLFKQKSKVSPRTYDSQNLLTGLIRCPQCNSPMVASRTVNHLKDGTKVVRRYYSCGQFRTKGSSVCSANSVPADYAEQYVVNRIQEVLHQPEFLLDIIKAINRKREQGVYPLKKELEVIETKLQQLTDKKKKIMDIYELDAMDKETLIHRMDELTAEEDVLQDRKSEIDCDLGDTVTTKLSQAAVQDVLMHFNELLEKSSFEQKKSLLHIVIEKITVKKGRKIDEVLLHFDEKCPAVNKNTAGRFTLPI